MSAQKFTAGPWSVEVSQNLSHTVRVVCNSDGEFGDDVCMVGDVTKGNNAADARLIAAAPRMYARIESLAAEGDAEAIEILEAVNGRAVLAEVAP